MERFIEGRAGSLRLSPQGVLHLQWAPGIAITEREAQAAVTLVNDVCSGAARPLFIDMTGTLSVSRDARTVFTHSSCASKIALLGASPVDRVLVNFFLGVHTPPCPTRYFTSRSEAVSWLRS
jgi:hypothetical protein